VLESGPRALVVEGAAGIGKTTLRLAAVADAAEASRWLAGGKRLG
jgi:hypothetical protein